MAVFIKEGVAVIGAGPGGLAMCARLRKKGISFTLFEGSDRLADSWRKHYDRLCLHTVKSLSHLPYKDFPEDYPVYVPRKELINYYETYAEEFEIEPLYHHKLENIEKVEAGWKLRFSNSDMYIFKTVVVATGVNRNTFHPRWPGEELYEGHVIHSREYKNPIPFLGSKVLVIGMGNTGAEIALDLSDANVETSISIRNQVLVVPRDIFGRPSQITANKLAKLPFGIGHWIGNTIRKILIGNVSKYGLRSNPVPPVKHLMETGKTPVMDLGTIKAIRKGKITVVPGITSFYEKGVITESGIKSEVPYVILATGYKTGLSDFLNIPGKFLDENELPVSPVGENELEGVYFLGFDNYQLGGILGAIYRDSGKIANHISQRVKS